MHHLAVDTAMSIKMVVNWKILLLLMQDTSQGKLLVLLAYDKEQLILLSNENEQNLCLMDSLFAGR
jgi:hypothetical protein